MAISDAEERPSEEGVDLNELQRETERLLYLLKDRHPGLTSWNKSLDIGMESVHRITSKALGK